MVNGVFGNVVGFKAKYTLEDPVIVNVLFDSKKVGKGLTVQILEGFPPHDGH